MDPTQAIAAGQMLGNLPTTGILGVIAIVLGWLVVKTYQKGIHEHEQSLRDIKDSVDKNTTETRNQTQYMKIQQETNQKYNEKMLNIAEQNLKELRDSQIRTEHKVEKVSERLGYKFDGTGIKLDK